MIVTPDQVLKWDGWMPLPFNAYYFEISSNRKARRRLMTVAEALKSFRNRRRLMDFLSESVISDELDELWLTEDQSIYIEYATDFYSKSINMIDLNDQVINDFSSPIDLSWLRMGA